MEIPDPVSVVFGGPAGGSSQFIVTKRAGASQFAASAVLANERRKGDGKIEISQSSMHRRILSRGKEKGGSRGASSPDPAVRR